MDIKKLWGDRAAIAVGVTNPGQGHETVIYRSAGQIAPAVAAVKAAGCENIGIYDLKGILESPDPETWFAVIAETKPAVPERGRKAAKRFRNFFKMTSSLISLMR